MQRSIQAVLCLCTLTTLAFAQGPGFGPGGPGGRGRRGRDDAPPPKLEQFTYEQGSFTSSKSKGGMEPGYGIFLPKGYADEANKDTRYPWVVWLHGFGGFGEFAGGGGAEVLDQLRKDDKIPPMVMVVFRAPGMRTTYLNGEQAGDIEDLIVGDLIDNLQKKYRLQTEREHRALMGVSMGGFGALKIAMHHPEVFGAVAVHSAAILPTDPNDVPQRFQPQLQRMRRTLTDVFGDPIDKAKWAHEMPLGLAAAAKPDEWKSLRIYFDAGTKDNYGLCEPNEQLDKVMTEKGIAHLFRKVEGGGHAWSSPKMKECLQSSLQFVGACVTGKDPMPKGDAAGDAAKKPADAGAGK